MNTGMKVLFVLACIPILMMLVYTLIFLGKLIYKVADYYAGIFEDKLSRLWRKVKK